MDENLKYFLNLLLNKKYIGGKHTPERRFVRAATKDLRPDGYRSFWKEYKRLVNEGFIIRLKKRTGKGSDWHISLNPEKLSELLELLRFDEEDQNE